jgi:hypothetical protein
MNAFGLRLMISFRKVARRLPVLFKHHDISILFPINAYRFVDFSPVPGRILILQHYQWMSLLIKIALDRRNIQILVKDN